MSDPPVDPGPDSSQAHFLRPAAGSPLPAGTLWHDLLESTWHGMKAGFRCATYIAGPIAVLLLIPGLLVCAFAAGTGRGLPFAPRQVGPFFGYGPFFAGLDVPGIVRAPIGFYLGCALLGLLFGAGLGLLGGLARRLTRRPARRTPRWWAWLVRPRGRSRGEPSVTMPAGPTPLRRRRRWPWLVGVPLALLLAVAFGAGVYAGRLVDRRLAAAIAAADRDDPDWRLDDLLAHREPVPEAENSALVVAEAVAQLPENWPSPHRTAPGAPAPPPSPAQDAFDALETAENVRLDTTVAETFRGELTTYAEAVRLARTAAGYRRGRHELNVGPTLLDTPLPETQASRTVARLLWADAAVRAHDGDLDGALDSCRAIIGVGRSIGDEPFLISHLVRISIGTMARTAAQRVLGQGEPSDAALQRLQTLLLEELNQPYLVQALRGERAVMTELIRRVGAGELPIAALSEGAGALDPTRPQTRVGGWIRLGFEYQRAVALEWSNAAVAIGQRPAPEQPALWDALEARAQSVRQTWYGPYTTTLPILLYPAISSVGLADVRHKSALGATLIGIAAERHRRRSGQWPAAIAAIDPDLLTRPPLDPYSGQAFRMERREGQFLVYSIGPNRKDEQEVSVPRPSVKGDSDDVAFRTWDPALRRQPPSGRVDSEPDTP